MDLAGFTRRSDPVPGRSRRHERYVNAQVGEADVTLGDTSVPELMQTDAFELMVKDPNFRALAASPGFQSLASQPQVMAAVMANPKAFAQLAANPQSFAGVAQAAQSLASLHLRRAPKTRGVLNAAYGHSKAMVALASQPQVLAAVAANPAAFAQFAANAGAFRAAAANAAQNAVMANNAAAFAAARGEPGRDAGDRGRPGSVQGDRCQCRIVQVARGPAPGARRGGQKRGSSGAARGESPACRSKPFIRFRPIPTPFSMLAGQPKALLAVSSHTKAFEALAGLSAGDGGDLRQRGAFCAICQQCRRPSPSPLTSAANNARFANSANSLPSARQ